MDFKRFRSDPSGRWKWKRIEDTSIKRIEDPSITGDVEFDSKIWADVYSKKATDLKELDEEKAKTIPGESNEERKIRYTKIDEQKEKILLDMYYDYIDATQLKEPSYETSEKPLSKDDEEAPALLQIEHTTSDEVNDTSLLDREVSKLKPEVNKSDLISKLTTETRADEDTPDKSEFTKSSPEYSRLEYTRMIREEKLLRREEKLLRNKIVEFIKKRQNYLRTSIDMRSIIMALFDNGVLDIKYTTFNDEDLNMAATKAADWALLPNNKLLIAEARHKLEKIEERKQKLRQLPVPAPLPEPSTGDKDSTAGGKSITKRYNNRRKTLRRKTLRKKTLRRKTLRRKKYYKN